MDSARQMLISHVQALLEDLRRAKDSLESFAHSHPIKDPESLPQKEEIVADLHDKLNARFGNEFAKRENDLKTLKKQLIEVRPGIDWDMPMCWQSFQNIDKRSRELFRETLSFLEGALLRVAGLDNDICRIADALVSRLSKDSLVPWDRFTIMAEDDFLTTMTGVIRLKFPQFNIWNLAVAGHEFGHHVGEAKKEIIEGIFSYIGNLDPTEEDKDFIRELFADLFATYALGPAYAFTCIELKFCPYNAYEDKKRHPADAKRVHFILRALEEMQKNIGNQFDALIQNLNKIWSDSLVACMQPAELDELSRGQLNIQLDRWFHEILERDLTEVKYESWPTSLVLAPYMLSYEKALDCCRNNQARLVDVLNAAWLCRQKPNNETKADEISRNAVKLCLEIAA